MTARLMFAGAIALSFAVAASAADPKPQPRDSSAPAAQHDLVLASADLTPPAPAANPQAAAPKRHRTARVTTCRCGGESQPQSDDTASE